MRTTIFMALALGLPIQAQAADSAIRIELRAGIANTSFDPASDLADAEDLEGSSKTAFNYGLEVGYEFPIGDSFVVGPYAGIDFASDKTCSEVLGDDLACLKNGRNFSAGIRGGVKLFGNTQLYAKGGYSNGRLKLNYDDGVGGLAPFTIADDRDGFHLGAGGEMAISSRTFAKIEYVYTDYANAKFADEDVSIGIDRSRHQVLVGVGMRF